MQISVLTTETVDSATGGGRLTINVSSLAVLTVGGLLVLQGRLSVGAMLAVNVYNTFLAVGLAQLAGSLGDLGKSLGSLQRCGVIRAGTCDPYILSP